MTEAKWKLGDSVQVRPAVQGVVTNQWFDDHGHEWVEVDWILPPTTLEADDLIEWRAL